MLEFVVHCTWSGSCGVEVAAYGVCVTGVFELNLLLCAGASSAMADGSLAWTLLLSFSGVSEASLGELTSSTVGAVVGAGDAVVLVVDVRFGGVRAVLASCSSDMSSSSCTSGSVKQSADIAPHNCACSSSATSKSSKQSWSSSKTPMAETIKRASGLGLHKQPIMIEPHVIRTK